MVESDSIDSTFEWTRISTLSKNEQSVVGICIFLTPENLQTLGIDPDSCKEIRYGITEQHGQSKLCLEEKKPSTDNTLSITD